MERPLTKLIVIGGSAGAIPKLVEIVRELPLRFPAAICVAIHLSPHSPHMLPAILQNAGSLPAKKAENGEDLKAGVIYIAPPDFHLLVHRGCLELTRGARENHNRPAIDPLFRSAALAYEDRAIGVLLSGFLDDGSAGLMAIKQLAGTAVVLDPNDSFDFRLSGMSGRALGN